MTIILYLKHIYLTDFDVIQITKKRLYDSKIQVKYIITIVN